MRIANQLGNLFFKSLKLKIIVMNARSGFLLQLPTKQLGQSNLTTKVP